MKRHYIPAIAVVTLLLLSLYACFTTSKVSQQNLSDSYHSDMHYLHPEFTLYHVNDSVSLLYFKIDESELLYVRRNQQDTFYASIRILCKASLSYESTTLEDSNSATLRFPSTINTKKEFAVGAIPLRLRKGNTYLLTVNTTDLYSKKNETMYINSDKTNNNSGNNFLVRDPANGYIIFPRYIDSAKSVALLYNKPAARLYVHYYRRNFPIAAPPFSELESKSFQYAGDSSFTVTGTSAGVFILSLNSEGFYHIQADTLNRTGLTLYRYGARFPEITEAYQMVEPLRYITSNDEYDKMAKADNVKKGVDDFWLNAAGGSKDRAKMLIRTYYNRVQDANRYFTSYEEGWRTDRGMLFIIYGAPNVIYRTSNSESWIYGEDRNFMSLRFDFQKVNNPFTDNDYSLQRAPQYRNIWYNAVDIWREGRVY